MTLHRLASPPPEIEAEAELFLYEWASIDTPLSFSEYLSHHASEAVKAYMKELAELSDEGEMEN